MASLPVPPWNEGITSGGLFAASGSAASSALWPLPDSPVGDGATGAARTGKGRRRAPTMRLYSLSVLYKGDPKVHLLKAAYDVSSFGFFQRSSVQEFMTFTSQLIVERSDLGTRASVKEQEYLCHVYVRSDGLAGVVVADSEYPPRVCFTLLDKVLDEFSRQVSRIDWPSGSPTTINYTALDSYLSRYQNPREADAMTKVQAELDETKIILHNTMESLLDRGEKLDDLVSKSEVLGAQSKAFYKTARKQNSCCKIM
ncbi:synaptobrevin-like protein YKT6 [Alligator mississippiensis]|uniref:Synaptobrevin-like protein YKT6 n=2 Tax=Alligator mississippiensis TaxID=8496 RepID=A0A151NWM1_ALLMI|nr:synaptobrevin-like protein YKT6 [Alligator mississippiensis]